jgi:hypothetical protein
MPEPAACCYRSAISPHRCSKCGCYPVLVHIAAAYTGFYCPRCCPACHERPAAKED